MNYQINIMLTPAIGPVIDLYDTPCKWDTKHNNLDFLDAPYSFYSFIDDFLGYDENENSPRSKFLDCFYGLLNDEIKARGFSDNLEFTLTMPAQFFALSFNISIYSE